MAALNISVPDSSLSTLRCSPNEFVREMKLAAAMHWYQQGIICLLYTSPSPRDRTRSRMPSSA